MEGLRFAQRTFDLPAHARLFQSVESAFLVRVLTPTTFPEIRRGRPRGHFQATVSMEHGLVNRSFDVNPMSHNYHTRREERLASP